MSPYYEFVVAQLQTYRLELLDLLPSVAFTVPIEINSLLLRQMIGTALQQFGREPAIVAKQSDHYAVIGKEVCGLPRRPDPHFRLNLLVAVVTIATIRHLWSPFANVTFTHGSPYSIIEAFSPIAETQAS